MMYVQAIGGLLVLLLGGDFLVRGAVAVARRHNVSKLTIGLTVVAFATSAPELVVGIGAALEHVPRLAIGNVVGSNIANVLLVLGLPALIRPIACTTSGIRQDTVLMVLASVIFIGLCLHGELVLWEGVMLIALLAGFLPYWVRRPTASAQEESLVEDFDAVSAMPRGGVMPFFLVALGFVALVIGAHYLIAGSIGIARSFHISEAVIGLTLVAVGTSLPELATSLSAALHRHADVAIGNVIGSNLFNILGVMGATAVVHDVPVPPGILGFDLWIMLAVAVLLGLFAFSRRAIGRLAGIGFLLAYAAYIMAVFDGISVLTDGAI